MIHEAKDVTPVTAAGNHGFQLKTVNVELLPSASPADRAMIALVDLETMRAQRGHLPASKHGLETICGASCEIGAQ